MNIYQRINAVMSECDYLQKKGAAQGKGIKYDEVMAMIRPLLIKHGIVMTMRQQELEQLEGGSGNQKIYQGYYTLALTNMDEPSEVVEHSTYAHGMDGGDKAPGKAHTYAAKLMLVKGFGIETGDDEESRSEKLDKLNVIDADQYKQLAQYCVDGDKLSATGKSMLGAYRLSSITQLPASKFDEALAKCKKRAEG